MKHGRKYGAGFVVAAMLGVMAFATSAQAVTELGSAFFIGGKEVAAKATVTAKQLNRGTLLIPSLSVEINCEKFSITDGLILNATDASGELLYEECTVLNLGGALEELAGCEIVINHELTVPMPHHITATALLLPAELKDGSPAVLAENISAKVLTHTELGCLLPKTTTVTGELCLKIDENHKVEPLLLASQAIQGECKARLTLNGVEVLGTDAEINKLESEGKAFLDKLLFGSNEAFVDGKADVALGGIDKGSTLGVLLI